MFEFKTSRLTSKIAYIRADINDDFLLNNDKTNGLQLGLGYEWEFYNESTIAIYYSYDLIKLKDVLYSDYDLNKFSISFRF